MYLSHVIFRDKLSLEEYNTVDCASQISARPGKPDRTEIGDGEHLRGSRLGRFGFILPLPFSEYFVLCINSALKGVNVSAEFHNFSQQVR